ncbi:MAG: iron-sulfur cluster assembly accessory protein [Bryobacterales bacterium]|nr:iron-sulfur cluster assembly accessory protein [Bryobacterales bacterium]
MIDVTPNAARKIRGMLAADNPGGLLRLGVIGGGCSGLQYKFRYERSARPADTVLDVDDIRLCVDPKSFEYLDGMTLDYVETLLEQRFLFKNPNAEKSCGCGKSFQV